MSDYTNKLIFGKNTTENIVCVEPYADELVLFREVDGKLSTEVIPNKYWTLTHERVSSKQIELDGNQHYKYMAEFDSLEEQRRVRGLIKKNKFDSWDIYNPKEASMVLNGVTYFKGMTPKDVSVLSWDIETTGLVMDETSRVLLISNTLRKNGIITRKLFAFDDYKSQRQMIDAWCKWVRDVDPSLFLGHNIFGFDLVYLRHVAKMHKTYLKLGRDDTNIKFDPYETSYRVDGSQTIDFINAQIFGREIVDTMFLARKYDIGKKYESYGLKNIIKQEKLEKKDRVFYDAGEIRHNYMNPDEWIKIKAYAIDDADDALALFDLMSPALFYFTQSISKSFQSIVNTATGAQINSFLIRAYLQDKKSIPKTTELTERVEGGISFAVPGVYKNLFKLDLKSCYPSQVLRFKLFDKEKDPEGFFYEMVKYFTYERFDLKKMYIKTKDIYYSDREQASKIFINSAYGLTNTPGLNFNAPHVAAKITEESRKIIDFALTWASGKGKDYWMKLFEEKTN
jgi:DNA polymerase I